MAHPSYAVARYGGQVEHSVEICAEMLLFKEQRSKEIKGES